MNELYEISTQYQLLDFLKRLINHKTLIPIDTLCGLGVSLKNVPIKHFSKLTEGKNPYFQYKYYEIRPRAHCRANININQSPAADVEGPYLINLIK